ncbi:unnamed protein product [Linum tenue]|uniref:pectinesterase n=1 Tax=Linum tenue TaxID=586396 RepID=A0AAV0KXN8_9ROSI|nr:unnamed protein product [Linum tenue]
MSLFPNSMFLLILLLLNSGQTAFCHTKGLRPGNSIGNQQVPPPPVNSTRTQFSEQQFLKWVRFVGSLKHSVFRAAKNKLFPSFTITVDRNPAAGDFTSIQDAVDSLPFINIVRVVIKVHAGVYTEKVSIPPLKSFITIEGAGAEKTIVQWGDTAKTPGPRGHPMGTYASATFAVNSPFFIAKNITFKVLSPPYSPVFVLCFLKTQLDLVWRWGRRIRRRFQRREPRGSRRWRSGYRPTRRHSWGADSWERKTLCMINWGGITTKTATLKGPSISYSATDCPSSRGVRFMQ